MMAKAQEHKASIIRFGRQYSKVQALIPTDEEWSTIETMERVLAPFYNYTLSVSKDQLCLPETLGIMWGLDDLLDDVQNKDGQFGDIGDDIQDAFATGVAQVEEYNSLINENIMYHVAAVLDPRIKCTLIKEQYGDGAKEIIQRIKDWLKSEYQQAPTSAASSIEPTLPSNANIHQVNLLLRARKSVASTLSDIDRYLDGEPLEWDDKDESNYRPEWLLEYWKANAFLFPLMALAARDILAVPGSEVDVERLFCGGKDLLGLRRHGLSGETMRILTLLKSYWQWESNENKAVLPEVRIALLIDIIDDSDYVSSFLSGINHYGQRGRQGETKIVNEIMKFKTDS
jgi:hAT family C-terminal dimerisation region